MTANNDVDMNAYWKRKVDKVVEIAKERGYDSLDKEFWENQPSIIISLIVDLYITDTNKAINPQNDM